jgi:hypothetical protein
MFMAYFKILWWHFPYGAKFNHKILSQDSRLWLTFECETF